MVSKAVLLLVVLVGSVGCVPARTNYPAVSSAEELPGDRQAGVISSIGSILFPAFTNVLQSFTSNVATSITNALTATMSGTRLELIPVEDLMGPSTLDRDNPYVQQPYVKDEELTSQLYPSHEHHTSEPDSQEE